MVADGGVVPEGETVFFGHDAEVIQDQADILSTYGVTNFIFHGAKNLFGLFNPCPRGCANVQPELPGIDTWEKVLADPGQGDKRPAQQHGEKNERNRAVFETSLQYDDRALPRASSAAYVCATVCSDARAQSGA